MDLLTEIISSLRTSSGNDNRNEEEWGRRFRKNIDDILLGRTARRFRTRHRWTAKRRSIPSHVLPISVAYRVLSSLVQVLSLISVLTPLTLCCVKIHTSCSFFNSDQSYLPCLLTDDVVKVWAIGWWVSKIFGMNEDVWMLFVWRSMSEKVLSEKVQAHAIVPCPHILT